MSFVTPNNGFSQRTAVVTGNWENPATWGNQSPPVITDAVTINNNVTVTVNGSAACASISLPIGVNSSGIILSGSNSLNVNGPMSVVAPTGNNNTRTINVGNGSLSAVSILLDGGNGKRNAILTIAAGTVTVTGAVTGSGTKSEIYLTGTGTLNIGGALTGISILSTVAGSTVNFFGTSPQTAMGVTYSTLKSNNPSGVTIDAPCAVTNLTIGDNVANSLFNDGSNQLTSTGTLNLVSGTLRIGGSGKPTVFPQFSTKNYGNSATVEFLSSLAQTVQSTIYPNLIFSGAGIKTTTAGTILISGSWSVGSTCRLNTNATIAAVTGNISGTGNIQQGSGAITIAGNWTNSGPFTAGTGGVIYNGANQTVGPVIYNDLTLAGTGIKTITGGTINGKLSMQGSATASAAPSYGTAAILEYKGNGPQTTGPEFLATMSAVIIDNAGGVSLSASRTINTSLTLTNGKVSTGPYTLGMGPTATITGANSSRYIYGNLSKAIPASGSAVTTLFETGDAGNYAPVSLTFTSISAPGSLTVYTIGSEDPSIGTSGIEPTLDVNRYWSITNSGLVFPGCNATFNFTSGDLDAGADPSLFIVGKYDAAWSYPSVGTRTATSTQTLGLTSFSRFALGQDAVAITILTQPVSQTTCEGTGISFTSTATGSPAPTIKWQVKTPAGSWGDMDPPETSTTLTITPVSVSMNGNQYRAVFTNTKGSATSNAATLTVNPQVPVSITITASLNSVCAGTSVTFTAVPVNGGAAPVYQWKVNGANSGSNLPQFTYVPLNNDLVSCSLTSSLSQCPQGNPATSVPISMVVFSRQPVSGTFVYNNNENTPLGGVTVKLVQGTDTLATVQTDPSGNYNFPAQCPGTYKVVARSTAPTGGINSTDVAQVNYWASLPYKIEEVRFFTGDVAGDDQGLPPNNYITAYDAQRIQAYYVSGGAFPFDRDPWSFWKAGDSISSNPSEPSTAPLYPSITVGGGPVSKDFYGLCTGDFNRSFIPGGKKSGVLCIGLRHSGTRSVRPGAEYYFPVYTETPLTAGALSLILNFPSEKIEILDVMLSGRNDKVGYTVDGNTIRIGWFSLDPFVANANAELLVLKLKIGGSLREGERCRVTLKEDPLNEIADENYHVIEGAILQVEDIEAGPGKSVPENTGEEIALRNYPNPFTGVTEICYSLPADGVVTIVIRTLLGEEIEAVEEEFQAAGTYRISVDLGMFGPGFYLATVRLKTAFDEQRKTIKLLNNR